MFTSLFSVRIFVWNRSIVGCVKEHDNERSLQTDVNELVEIKFDIDDDKRTGILGVVDLSSCFVVFGGVVRFIDTLKLTWSSS